MYAEARFSDALADPSDPIMWRRTATTDRSKNPVCASIASLTNAARLQKKQPASLTESESRG
jgi:hypothetical protein